MKNTESPKSDFGCKSENIYPINFWRSYSDSTQNFGPTKTFLDDRSIFGGRKPQKGPKSDLFRTFCLKSGNIYPIIIWRTYSDSTQNSAPVNIFGGVRQYLVVFFINFAICVFFFSNGDSAVFFFQCSSYNYI